MKDSEDTPTNPPLSSEQILRNRAEEKLRILEGHTRLGTLGLEDTQKLIYELQTHRIELELQNEELRRTQVELEETRSKYFELYEIAPVGYCTVSEKGLILETNLTTAKLLDVTQDALINKPIARFIYNEDQDIYYLHNRQLVKTGIQQSFELRMIKKDDRIFWARLNVTASHDSKDQPVLLFVLSDITQHKQAVEDLRRIELQKSEDRFRKLFIEQTPAAIAMFDRDMRYMCASRRWSNDHGLGDRDLYGLSHYEVLNIPEHWKEAHRRGLKGEVLRAEEDRYERSDGSVYWLRWEIRPWYGMWGDIGGIVIFTEDITELKQKEEQLQALNEELEWRVEQRTQELQEKQSQYLHAAKLSAIGKLSASIAHEFNNPLQAVIPILQGFKKWRELEEKDRVLLDLAISENIRMKNLIRSLQDFNRPSVGKKILMDMHASIDSLLLLCKSDFKGRRIVTTLNFAKRLPQILAVPDQIKQVFLNLLTNAADACLNGGTIMISTWQEDERVAVAIKDNGIGIEPEKMDQIFQPFYTTKPAVKGTGLGLSVCHGIIQNHHGEIRVESEPGEGSTFTIVLPVDREDQL